jgi:quercetin dioxygenase-like cupin family protein
MEPGKLVPLHSHIDPECFYLLEGQIDVYVVDDAPKWRMVETGHSYLVSNGVKHAVRAVFTPPTSEDTPRPTDIGTHRRLKAPR